MARVSKKERAEKKARKERRAARKARRAKEGKKKDGGSKKSKKDKETDNSTEVRTGYCVKCKKKREMLNPKVTKMKNGRPMAKGKCPKCGTTICCILSTI